MGKTGKWIKNFLTGKKAKDNNQGGNASNEDSSLSTEIPQTPLVVPPNTPKEKRRWSFRRSPSGAKNHNSMDSIAITPRSVRQSIMESSQKQQHSLAVATTTDEALKAAQMAASVIRLAAASNRRKSNALQEAAATMIQSVFRSYLARKALCALKGLVKLQALVRGHLVRKQAVTTLRCMQALVNVQARTRAHRIQMAEEAQVHSQRSSNYRTSPQENRYRQTYNMDGHMEDKIKVVEMDPAVSRGSTRRRNSYFDHSQIERAEQVYSPQYHAHLNQDYYHQMSPALSAVPDTSPRVCSGHFDQYSLSTEQSSPHCYSTVSKQDPIRVPCTSPQPYVDSVSHDHTFFPNYMANTESFKAKARSQSAPKQRTDLFERQQSRKKASVEGRNVPRIIRMQRSSSHVGSDAQGKQFPWSIKLDRSAISLKDSECGSTSTVLTNSNYCRSLAAVILPRYNIHANSAAPHGTCE